MRILWVVLKRETRFSKCCVAADRLFNKKRRVVSLKVHVHPSGFARCPFVRERFICLIQCFDWLLFPYAKFPQYIQGGK